jgi:hypothetical protein
MIHTTTYYVVLIPSYPCPVLIFMYEIEWATPRIIGRDAFTSMPSQTPHFLKAADFPDDELEASVCIDYTRTICGACRIRTLHNPRYDRPVENGVSGLRASSPPPQQHPRYVYWSAAYI